MKNYFKFLVDGDEELSWPEAVLLGFVLSIIIGIMIVIKEFWLS